MDPRERLFVAAANSKDGKRLFEVWDLATHSRRNTLNIDLHHVTGISFSSDGAFFVLGSWEGSQVYETEEFGLIDQFSGYVSGQSRASFSSKGLLPVPLNQQNRLAIRDFRKHERLAVLEEDDDIFSGSFTPDGQSLLTASSRRISRYAFAGAQECLDLTGHRMSVPGIAFSRDGSRLASVSIDQTMRVWDANTGKLISQSNQLLLAEGQTICFSPDGRVVCTGDYDSPTIQFWDVESGKKLMEVKDTLESGTWSLLWLPDPKIGSRLIRGSRGSGPDSVVSMWKLASSDALLASRPGACELLNSIPQEGMVCGLVVSPDQKRMVYRVNDTDKPGKLLSAEVSAPQQRNELPYEPRFMMQGVAFTSDSGHVAMVTKENTVIIVDLEAERVVRTFDCGHSFSDKLVISSDGRWLALESGSFLGVDIYDFNAGKLLYSLPDREGTVYWIAWQPGSARLAVARDNGAIEIWDMNRIDNQLEQLGLGLESKSSTTKQTPSKPKTRPANKPVSIGPDEADH
jgi:WD40 repeat protein